MGCLGPVGSGSAVWLRLRTARLVSTRTALAPHASSFARRRRHCLRESAPLELPRPHPAKGEVVSLFLSSCPLWLTALLVVILPTVAAAGVLVLVRNRVGLARLMVNNEVAGFKFAVVGVLYAVLLAFAVIVVWQRYTEAEVAVIREAGAAATLYRLGAGPEPEARQLRAALGAYLTQAIERDWPQMAREQGSAEANRALDALYSAALHLAQTSRQPAVLVPIFNQIDLITEARRSRLHLAIGIMPAVLWAALLLGGLLTVGFTF